MISNHTMVLYGNPVPHGRGWRAMLWYDCCFSQPKRLCLSYAVEAIIKLEEKNKWSCEHITIPALFHNNFHTLGENNSVPPNQEL